MSSPIYGASGGVIMPEDYSPGLADLLWHDDSDRRYILGECTDEEYYTSRDAIMYENALAEGGGSPPADMPGEIAYEIEEMDRIRRERGDI